MAANENKMILCALKGNARVINLDNSKLTRLPPAITRLTALHTLSAKNNFITEVEELRSLSYLVTINLGGNKLKSLPFCLAFLTRLENLHLFKNEIANIPDETLGCLGYLDVLNLNNNILQTLPSSIISLQKLKILSCANNRLSHIPRNLCHLGNLLELHLEGNQIQQIPTEIGALQSLKKLYLQKNEITYLPQTIKMCQSLHLLDVSCNQIQLFPSEIKELKLQELFYEVNPLLPPVPVPSEQAKEILPLKELVSRYVVKESLKTPSWVPGLVFEVNRYESVQYRDAVLMATVEKIPEIKQLLSYIGQCALCGGPFVNSWLDCVEFVHTKNLFHLRSPNGLIPIRAVLCSYECFNSEGHNYYGIATSQNVS